MTIETAVDHSSVPSWDRVHARTASLRQVVAGLDAGRPLPADVEAFADRGELLRALHATWSRRLNGRIDLALETDDHELTDAVASAWLDTADDLPGIRRILDENADHPALAPVQRAELRTVAVAAGLATFDDPVASSARLGDEFVRGLRRRGRPLVQRSSAWARFRRALLG